MESFTELEERMKEWKEIALKLFDYIDEAQHNGINEGLLIGDIDYFREKIGGRIDKDLKVKFGYG